MTGEPITVAAITGGRDVPSTRFRVRQYLPSLAEHGVRVRELVPRVPKYPPRRPAQRPGWLLSLAAIRAGHALRSWRCDATWLQREMISTLPSFELLCRRPLVFDVDDAIWLNQRFRAVERIAERSDLLIAGNAYIADHLGSRAARVTILPTPVDTQRWQPRPDPDAGPPIIGWTGTSSNFQHLELVRRSLAQALRAVPGARLRIVADRAPRLEGIPPERVEFVRWSPEVEVAAVQGMTVGIMPLEDDRWTRGKCSFKMLLYMAVGIPVVVSPVGMNRDVLSHEPIGHGADTQAQWRDALVHLLVDADARARFGANARRVAVELYSVEVLAARLADVLRSVVTR